MDDERRKARPSLVVRYILRIWTVSRKISGVHREKLVCKVSVMKLSSSGQ